MRHRDEQLLERAILRELGARRDLAIFKNEVGQGYYGALRPVLLRVLGRFGQEVTREADAVLNRHRVTYGLAVGSADLVCVAAPHGRLVSIELKSPQGVLRPEQCAWMQRMRALGGVAGEARGVEEAAQLIEEGRRP